MKEENSRKRIDWILRDIRPLRRKPAEAPPEKKRTAGRTRRKFRFPRRLARALFVLGLATLVLVVSVSSARYLIQGETGQSSFGELKEFVGTLIAINSDLNKLGSEGLDMAFNGRGEELIATLKNLRTNVDELNSLEVSFIDQTTLDTASEGLGALITLLDKPDKQRLLVFFLNPSEMRPIGGFAGSYGEVVLERGNIREIKVNDIYYPDKFLDKKIVPPKELQTVTMDWGARDAAWFFDFPTSAEKTMELLEASDLYARDGIHFDGAVALNVRVIEDILSFTGPIKLPEYNLTLGKDNFLEEIQREVETGRDKQAGENPKRALSALTPVLIEHLSKLDSSEKKTLFLALFGRIVSKDIQFYLEDPQVESFVKRVNWAGAVAILDDDFSGDYLAVVNTNVAGGKTDARINQKIKLKSEINAEGKINNYLTVTRSHLGREDEAPWYRAKNQNFIKIFTPGDAELISLSGATPKDISPRIDYESAGYSRDPLLNSIERTRKSVARYSTEIYRESDKNVFAAWFSTPAGETKTLEVNYKSTQFPLANGAKYRFIMDKQSGVESALEYEIVAPPGYGWRESNGSTFAYKSDTIPARLTIDLTLVRSE